MGCLMNMPAAAEVIAVWLYQSLYSAHSGERGRWYGNSCSLFAGDLSSTGAVIVEDAVWRRGTANY